MSNRNGNLLAKDITEAEINLLARKLFSGKYSDVATALRDIRIRGKRMNRSQFGILMKSRFSDRTFGEAVGLFADNHFRKNPKDREVFIQSFKRRR